MGSSVLVVTLLSALNPVRLALTLLVISRPRPVQNLLAFWAGCLTGAIPAVVIPLTLAHVASMSDSVGQHAAASSTVRHVQIAMGVLALTMAAVITVRSLTRRRRSAISPARKATDRRQRQEGIGPTLVLDPEPPNAFERLLGRAQEAPTEGGSTFRRLLHHLHRAWENGALWVTYVIGVGFGGPQPDVSLFVITIIVASGATVGTQFIAAAGFVVGTMAVIEVILLSYLVTPAKTQAVLRVLHNWVSAHRRKILVSIFAVVGAALVTQGMGG